MRERDCGRAANRFAAAIVLAVSLTAPAAAQGPAWMNPKLSPDARADLVMRTLSLDDKLVLLVGHAPLLMHPKPADVPYTSGYVPSVAGLPPLYETDAGLGVTDPEDLRHDEGSTVLPSGLAQASTWDPDLAREGGAMLGSEAHNKGLNVVLAGGINLARDPHGGRNFEYAGEDPLLAGTMVGSEVQGIQSQYEISTLKHYALNDQETGRFVADASIDEASARESDLLAFEIAIERGDVGSIMCAYNQLSAYYACENQDLLTTTLKQDWRYKGFVMSDWGGTHSTELAALSGLDQEDGEEYDGRDFFGAPLKAAVLAGRVPQARLDDMVHRILRTMFAKGVVDHPAALAAIDYDADAKISQRIAEEAIVLLKNDAGRLPLPTAVSRIAVIGGHAEMGVLGGGGGSSEVTPHGGNALKIPHPEADFEVFEAYIAPSPLKAITARVPNADVEFADGTDVAGAAAAAKAADVAIVFATQWTSESVDAANLSLPNSQDALIEAIAAANPHTIVVLETSGPVLMPWLGKVEGVIEAWCPGSNGAEAIARVLFGEVDPSGRTAITFPASEDQLPRPLLPGYQAMLDARKASGNPHAGPSPFAIDYFEGANVGYRWYQTRRITPLFPFGYGLSYTSFAYSNLKVTGGPTLAVSFDVTNTGTRAGFDTPQVYAAAQMGGEETVRHLVGWNKIALNPGERRRVSITADPRLLATFDPNIHGWHIAAHNYRAYVCRFAGDVRLYADAPLAARTLQP